MYPNVKIYAVPEPDGKLAPVLATLDGRSLPILEASIEASPNGTAHGTRAITATLTFLVGAETAIEVVSRDELAEIEDSTVPLGAEIVRDL